MERVSWMIRLLFILSLTTLLSACSNKNDATTSTEPGRPVKALTLTSNEQGLRRSYPGRVQAKDEADISFEVPGKIVSFPVLEGQQLAKGDVIAKLDNSDYQNRFNQEQSKYNYALATFNRYNELVKSGTVTKADYDLKEADLKVQENNLAIAKKALDDTSLLAPFAGFIAKKYVNNYQVILAHQPIVILQDLSDIDIIINIPEQDFHDAKNIDKASGLVSFPIMPNQKFNATIKEYKTAATGTTQTYQITLTMPRPGNAIILPGMTADVSFAFASATPDTFSIPASAIAIDEQGNKYVWVIDNNTMTVHKQAVKVSSMTGSMITVLSGLKGGEQIVIAGVSYLQEDMKVQVITAANTDDA